MNDIIVGANIVRIPNQTNEAEIIFQQQDIALNQ